MLPVFRCKPRFFIDIDFFRSVVRDISGDCRCPGNEFVFPLDDDDDDEEEEDVVVNGGGSNGSIISPKINEMIFSYYYWFRLEVFAALAHLVTWIFPHSPTSVCNIFLMESTDLSVYLVSLIQFVCP